MSTLARSYVEHRDILLETLGGLEEPSPTKRFCGEDVDIGQSFQELEHLDTFLSDYEPFDNLVEIGVFKGGSMWMLSRYLRPGVDIIGIDVDIHDVRAETDKVLSRLRMEGFSATVLWQSSKDALPFVAERFWGTGIHLLHIDGAHDWDTALHDWNHYVPLVRKGGMVLFHDIYNVNIRATYYLWKKIKEEHPQAQEIRTRGGQGMGIVTID
jgi:predicted O-methyltransferase YrrM